MLIKVIDPKNFIYNVYFFVLCINEVAYMSVHIYGLPWPPQTASLFGGILTD
jgi:hypothetical protein